MKWMREGFLDGENCPDSVRHEINTDLDIAQWLYCPVGMMRRSMMTRTWNDWNQCGPGTMVVKWETARAARFFPNEFLRHKMAGFA